MIYIPREYLDTLWVFLKEIKVNIEDMVSNIIKQKIKEKKATPKAKKISKTVMNDAEITKLASIFFDGTDFSQVLYHLTINKKMVAVHNAPEDYPAVSLLYDSRFRTYKLEINLEKYNKKSAIEKKFLLAHNIYHTVYKHGSRTEAIVSKFNKSPAIKKKLSKICEVASDLVVNEYLKNRLALNIKQLTEEYEWFDVRFPKGHPKVNANSTFEEFVFAMVKDSNFDDSEPPEHRDPSEEEEDNNEVDPDSECDNENENSCNNNKNKKSKDKNSDKEEDNEEEDDEQQDKDESSENDNNEVDEEKSDDSNDKDGEEDEEESEESEDGDGESEGSGEGNSEEEDEEEDEEDEESDSKEESNKKNNKKGALMTATKDEDSEDEEAEEIDADESEDGGESVMIAKPQKPEFGKHLSKKKQATDRDADEGAKVFEDKFAKEVIKFTQEDIDKIELTVNGYKHEVDDAEDFNLKRDAADLAKEYASKEDLEKLKKVSKEMFATGGAIGRPGDILSPGKAVEIIIEANRVINKKWESVIKRWTRFDEEEAYIGQFIKLQSSLALLNRDEVAIPHEAEVIHKNYRKINILFFLDTSGSCQHFAPRFYHAASTLDPKRFNVRLFSRTTQVTEVQPGQSVARLGGEDDFSCMERFIQDEIKSGKSTEYPDAVFHITDGGDCNRIKMTCQYPERWHWFLVDGGDRSKIPDGCNIHRLSDFEGFKDS